MGMETGRGQGAECRSSADASQQEDTVVRPTVLS